jgi:hypothetical protein
VSEIRSQATPARDELAETVFDLLTRVAEVGTSDRNVIAHGIAMGLDDAGWSKPRTVNSAAELDALPVESVVRNANGWIGEISIVSGKPVIFWIGNECEDELKDITLPATVLFTPGDAR